MSQAIVNPEELRRFAARLKQFNNEMIGQLSTLHGQLAGLSQTWRDREHDKFVEEFEQMPPGDEAVHRSRPTSTSRSCCVRQSGSRNTCNSDRNPAMSRSANVLSTQTLKDFKMVMCNFAEEARNSLSGVDMELRRMRDWLERDQLGYWQSQVKKRQEDLMQARADLHKRKISQQGSEAVSDAEQKEALRVAQRRLQVAEEKVQIVRKLIPQLHHAIDEYHSHSQPLGDHLSGGFEKSLFTMDKMIGALDAYLALKAPGGPRLDSAQASGPASSGSQATSGQTTTSGEPPSAEPATTQSEKRQETASPESEPAVSGRV